MSDETPKPAERRGDSPRSRDDRKRGEKPATSGERSARAGYERPSRDRVARPSRDGEGRPRRDGEVRDLM